MISSLLQPMMHLNKKSSDKMEEFKEYLDWIREMQQDIDGKFEDAANLSKSLKATQKNCAQLSINQNREMD